MPQVLSQDEVDALLQGIAKEGLPVGPSTPGEADSVPPKEQQTSPNEVTPYDFTRNEAYSRWRLPGLEVIFANFAQRVQSMFASELGKSVDAVFEGMQVVSYESLIQSFPLPASIHTARLEPLRGVGVFVVEARLAFAMIELFFGGSGQKSTKVEGRDFTPIESTFLGKFVERMLRGMEESWRSVMPLKGRYLRSEINPYLLNAAGMGDAMIVATYSIQLAPIRGSILFALPSASIEEVREKLKTRVPMGEDSENSGIFKRFQGPLMDIEVEVQAVVDVVDMSVGEIMGLRPGDIIQLNRSGLQEVELWVEGKRKFIGKGAQKNGHKVLVTSRPCNGS
jgi:flagellar motor switch protein FliM